MAAKGHQAADSNQNSVNQSHRRTGTGSIMSHKATGLGGAANIKMQCALKHTTTYMYTCVWTCIQICSYGVEASVSNYDLNKHKMQAFNKRQREQQSKVIRGQVCDLNSTQILQ